MTIYLSFQTLTVKRIIVKFSIKVNHTRYTHWPVLSPHLVVDLMGGFARGNTSNGTPRDYWKEGIRNALKQASLLLGVDLAVANYIDLNFTDALLYCDPPYKGTTGYRKGLVPEINHNEFWEWCRKQAKQGCEVFVSEYSAPEDFTEVWSAKVSNTLSRGQGFTATEKLYKLSYAKL